MWCEYEIRGFRVYDRELFALSAAHTKHAHTHKHTHANGLVSAENLTFCTQGFCTRAGILNAPSSSTSAAASSSLPRCVAAELLHNRFHCHYTGAHSKKKEKKQTKKPPPISHIPNTPFSPTARRNPRTSKWVNVTRPNENAHARGSRRRPAAARTVMLTLYVCQCVCVRVRRRRLSEFNNHTQWTWETYAHSGWHKSRMTEQSVSIYYIHY